MIMNDFIRIGERLRNMRRRAPHFEAPVFDRAVDHWRKFRREISPYLDNTKAFALDEPASLLCALSRAKERPSIASLPFERMTLSAHVPTETQMDTRRIGIIFNVEMREGLVGGVGFLIQDAETPVGTLPIDVRPILFGVKDGRIEIGAMDPETGRADAGIAPSPLESAAEELVNGLLWLVSRPSRYTMRPSNLRKANIRRQLAGKPALLEYNEIRIDLFDEEEPEQRGPVARKPCKEHDRRGHPRRLRNGKVIWVRECRPGSREVGMIESRYVAGDTPGDDWKGGPLPAPKLIKKERGND